MGLEDADDLLRSGREALAAADWERARSFFERVASGWMGRAESLLEGVEECAAHGWRILDRAPFSRDPSEREKCAASALTIARRFGEVRGACSARRAPPPISTKKNFTALASPLRSVIAWPTRR
jgi:hypothetical protein